MVPAAIVILVVGAVVVVFGVMAFGYLNRTKQDKRNKR